MAAFHLSSLDICGADLMLHENECALVHLYSEPSCVHRQVAYMQAGCYHRAVLPASQAIYGDQCAMTCEIDMFAHVLVM